MSYHQLSIRKKTVISESIQTALLVANSLVLLVAGKNIQGKNIHGKNIW